jgi:hypothetical protein
MRPARPDRRALRFTGILPALVVAAAVFAASCDDSVPPAGNDSTYVVGYCSAAKNLYAQRTTNWKSYVRDPSLTPPADVTTEVRQAWAAYADALRALNPPADLREWHSALVEAVDDHVKIATTVLALEQWVGPAPMPESVRRLEPIADSQNCSLPFRIGF